MERVITNEIERRFIVQSVHLPGSYFGPVRIEQGYLGQGLRVRIENGERGTITRKTGKGIERIEETCVIPIGAARLLFESAPHTLIKDRYVIDGWEIDFFLGSLSGLIVMERELDRIDEPCPLPSWVDAAVEVTESVTNQRLAKLASDLSMSSEITKDIPAHLLRSRVPKIVLTGAPCSGKSTAIDALRRDHPEYHCVPEAATIVMGQVNVSPAIGEVAFQQTLRSVQTSFEEGACKTALYAKKRAVILDRGTLDSAAWIGGLDTYEQKMQAPRADEFARYDAVIFLSLPPQEIYEANKANNSVRRESYDEALEVEDALYKVWATHPKFIWLPDAQTWEAKYQLLRETINHIIEEYPPR